MYLFSCVYNLDAFIYLVDYSSNFEIEVLVAYIRRIFFVFFSVLVINLIHDAFFQVMVCKITLRFFRQPP